jgi:hypothetical protein
MSFLAGQKIRASEVNDLLPIIVRLDADRTVTSSTTLTAATGLVAALDADTRYALTGYIAAEAGDLKVAFAAPTGTTGHWTLYAQDTAATGGTGSIVAKRATAFGTGTTQTAAGDNTGPGPMACLPRGYIVTDVTAGSLQVYFAQNSSSATSTILKAGSWLRLIKLT